MRKTSSDRRGARLGQHFLTGLWAARKLAAAVSVREDETILEIGPGKGALTRELLATGANVVAIEKDENLVKQLQKTFAGEIAGGKLKLVAADIRDFSRLRLNLNLYSVAANIPYYITGEIIRQFLTTKNQPRAMALLVQKEVAERIMGKGERGKGKESILSLSVKAYGMPKIIAKVSRGNFSPPPSVDSAILLIDKISKDFFNNVSEEDFFRTVRAGFASKRKLLLNNLAAKLGFTKSKCIEAFGTCSIAGNARAEDLPLEKWKCLARLL